MTTLQLKSTTTEDLIATCQNFPTCAEALDCANELVRRCGKNRFSDIVFLHSGKWGLGESA